MQENQQDLPLEEQTTPEIAPDLLMNVEALRAFATIYNLLDKGHFTHNQSHAVIQGMGFVRTLYERVKDECLAHPDADKVAELTQLKIQKEK